MTVTYVITTIQPPTSGVRAIAEKASEKGDSFVVVGDRKSPREWSHMGIKYLSIQAQEQLDFALVQALPENTYTRKMLGYLMAAQQGTEWIRETDDDNLPYEDFFAPPQTRLRAVTPTTQSSWLNIYSYFTDRFVWPRGFPLSIVSDSATKPDGESEIFVEYPYLLQAVADGDPDVDAIYRLTAPNSSDITFKQKDPLALPHGTWTPFNSQATTWPSDLFSLMYLPVTCTFRMTDIWRSFVVQRLLPGLGATLVVTPATVFQERNEHDLMQDFGQEVPGYLGTERIRAVLEATSIRGGQKHVLDDLRSLYEALVTHGFLLKEELTVLDAWIVDMQSLELRSSA